MTSTQKALQIDTNDGRGKRKCQIHLGQNYPNRNNLVKLIKDYGGYMEYRIAQADVVIVQDQINKVEYIEKKIVSMKQCKAVIVVEPWLHACIDRGKFISPELQRYRPKCLDRDRPTTNDLSDDELSTKSTGINQRRLRNDYTVQDEEIIIQVLSVWTGTLLQASELLSRMQEHTKQSFQTHLNGNMDQGKFYTRRIQAFKRLNGGDELEQIRSSLLAFAPDMADCLRMNSRNMNREGREHQEQHASLRILKENPTRANNFENESNQIEQQSPQRGTPVRAASTTKSPTKSLAHVRIETTIMTPDSTLQNMQSVSNANFTLPTVRLYPQEQREALIKELTLYLKSLYKDLPASQDGSVIGYLESSQDIPEPPKELFEHMARIIPSHSSEEWQIHFSKPTNRASYLDLAREGLEKMLLQERADLFEDVVEQAAALDVEEEPYDQLVDELPELPIQQEQLRITTEAPSTSEVESARQVIKEEDTIESLIGTAEEEERDGDTRRKVMAEVIERGGVLFFSSQADSEEEVDEMEETQESDLSREGLNVDSIAGGDEEEMIETIVAEEDPESDSISEESEANLDFEQVILGQGEAKWNSTSSREADIATSRTHNETTDSSNSKDNTTSPDDDDQIGSLQEEDERSKNGSGHTVISEQNVIVEQETIFDVTEVSDSSSRSSTSSLSRSRSHSTAATYVPPPIVHKQKKKKAVKAPKKPKVSLTTLAKRTVPYVEIDNGGRRSPFSQSVRKEKISIRPIVIGGYKRRRLSSSSEEGNNNDEEQGKEKKVKRAKKVSSGKDKDGRNKGIFKRLHEIIKSDPGLVKGSTSKVHKLKRLRLGVPSKKDQLDILAEKYNTDRRVVEGFFKAVNQDYNLLESILKVPR